MTEPLQTVSPDQLGERAQPSDDLFALVFAPGGPIQKLAFNKLLGKLIAANLTKATKALLDTDLAHAADEVALVFNDPTSSLNGWYRKTGISGAGAWEQFDTLSLAAKVAAETAATASEASRVRSGNALPFPTWAALSAATGMVSGDRARVRASDTGTHTDPVVGGTVKNAGDYTYSASPAGWQRTGDLDSQTASDLVGAVSGIVVNIETDAFAMAVVDNDGFLIELLGNDFLRQSPNQTYLLDLISHVTIETDAFAYAKVDKDGFLIDLHDGVAWKSMTDALGATTATDPTIYIPAGDYLAAMVYGQSVFRGFDTTAISTGTYSGGGLLMFNAGMAGFDYSVSTNLASLVAARESGVESAGRGVGEAFAQFFASEAGYAMTDDGVNLILSVAAEGGKSASELSDGGTWFPRLKSAIDAIDTLARAGAKVPDVVHLVYCQGEQDIANGTAPTLWYSQIENGIRKPFEAYCQARFGRKTGVKIIMTQVASHQYYNVADPAIARQALAICNSDANYVLAGAMYQYDYGANGVGSHLLSATDVKLAGAMAGRALQRTARGVRHKWINPLRAWQDGPRTVAIEYDVPVGPLVIDTVNVSDPGQRGFNLYSGSTEVPISAVSIVGLRRRTVLLTTSSDIPAGAIRVDYAHKGGASGSPAGRVTGSRGCLRDSDPAVFDPSGINKPLFNWAPIHRITVG
ncbi:hypothetical protein [Novosphingobium sp. NDB2Meth1]|uniref:hypothetical protein n=1 Tax=Novosphingobium sp. NDB2Meth1 TaxID=1892847 RepID=UPI0009313D2F|nr:hypothetical protein [Novosphingobium sp. NDB2Meth1]